MSLPDFEPIAATLRRSIVQVVNDRGGGSGVIWNAAGAIVTNAHVARGGKAVVVDASGARVPARVILRDPDADLALLQPESALSAPPAAIADSDSVRPGQLVIALGNPLGVPGAVSAGIVHLAGAAHNAHKWLHADVRLAPGNSGGALADASGRVIGITTMIWNGLALAAPSNAVDAFVRRAALKQAA